MSFQDELKQSLRTPEIVKKENDDKEKSAMFAEATSTLEDIKRTLLTSAKNANYTTRNDVTTVSCICRISQRFMRIRHESNSKEMRQNQQTFFLLRNHNFQFEMWESYEIEPRYSSEYNQYMSTLKKLAREEGIDVECVVYGDVGARGEQAHSFPAKVTRTYGALRLGIRARTSIK